MSIIKLKLPDDFVQGVIKYADHYPEDNPNHARIVIPITIGYEDELTVDTILDTGGICVLNPAYSKQLSIEGQGLPAEIYKFRGRSYEGEFYRIPIKLIPSADTGIFAGEGIAVEIPFFIPKIPEGEEWTLPNFLGYQGFLNTIRFALDPEKNLFYFGTLGREI